MRASYISKQDNLPISGFYVFTALSGKKVIPLIATCKLFCKSRIIKPSIDKIIFDDDLISFIKRGWSDTFDKSYPGTTIDSLSNDYFITLDTFVEYMRQTCDSDQWNIPMTESIVVQCIDHMLGNTFASIEHRYLNAKKQRIRNEYMSDDAFVRIKNDIYRKREAKEHALMESKLAEGRAYIEKSLKSNVQRFENALAKLERRKRKAESTIIYIETQNEKDDDIVNDLEVFPLCYPN